MVEVDGDPEGLVLLHHPDQLLRDPHREEDRHARADPQELQVRDRPELGEKLLERRSLKRSGSPRRSGSLVPPGVRTAVLKITDKLGNTTEKPLDLAPRPSRACGWPRARKRPRSRWRSSWSSRMAPRMTRPRWRWRRPTGRPACASASVPASTWRSTSHPGSGGDRAPGGEANGQLATLEVPLHAAPAGARQARGSGPGAFPPVCWAAWAGPSSERPPARCSRGRDADRIVSPRSAARPGLDLSSRGLAVHGVTALTERAKAQAWLAQIGARGKLRGDAASRGAWLGRLRPARPERPHHPAPEPRPIRDSGLSARLAIAAA